MSNVGQGAVGTKMERPGFIVYIQSGSEDSVSDLTFRNQGQENNC